MNKKVLHIFIANNENWGSPQISHWVDAGVVTEQISEHKLFSYGGQVEEKNASVDVDWWEKNVSIVLLTVETCVANQIQTFGQDNYSRQMCLLVDLKNAY